MERPNRACATCYYFPIDHEKLTNSEVCRGCFGTWSHPNPKPNWRPANETENMNEDGLYDLKYAPTCQQYVKDDVWHSCADCKHGDLHPDEPPCFDCVGNGTKWEPEGELTEWDDKPLGTYTNENPAHYQVGGIQPLDFIEANSYLGFHEGNIIKYVCRYQFKNGVEDLKKARTYLDRLIAREESKVDRQ